MTKELAKKNRKKAIKKKVRRHRLKRGIRKSICAIAGIACAAGAYTWIMRPVLIQTHTDTAEYQTDEILSYANERILNTTSRKLSRIPVIAHRGFSENVLDNSYAAFDQAMSAGCPQIELDVHASSDGVLYVNHDPNLKECAGLDWNIKDHSSAELDGILMKNGEKLHRLSEALERYRDQMIYLIELKDENDDPMPFLDVAYGHANLAQNMQIQSFNADLIENIHKSLPNMFVQLLISDEALIDEALGWQWLDSLALDQKLISQDRIDWIHRNGKEVWIWTVDNLDDIHKYLSWGADGVITDLDSAVVLYKEMSQNAS